MHYYSATTCFRHACASEIGEWRMANGEKRAEDLCFIDIINFYLLNFDCVEQTKSMKWTGANIGRSQQRQTLNTLTQSHTQLWKMKWQFVVYKLKLVFIVCRMPLIRLVFLLKCLISCLNGWLIFTFFLVCFAPIIPSPFQSISNSFGLRPFQCLVCFIYNSIRRFQFDCIFNGKTSKCELNEMTIDASIGNCIENQNKMREKVW